MNVVELRGALRDEPERESDVATPAEAETSSAPAAPVDPVASLSEADALSDTYSSSSSAVATQRAYPAPAESPTQQGPTGLRFDFNDGCRVLLEESEHPWRVRLSDLDTGNILFETELKAGRVNSSKRYYVRFRVEAWQNGESIFVHEFSATDRDILI